MRRITKGPEPQGLRSYRQATASLPTYRDLPDREALRETLIQEQRGLCCYCMGRVQQKTASIEHWKPRSVYPEDELSWWNLFAVCPGGAGTGKVNEHCDKRKAATEISMYPADPAIEQKVGFSATGEVVSQYSDLDVQRQIDEVLGLNIERLKSNRNSVLKSLKEACQREAAGQWTRSFIEKKIARLESGDELVPYASFLVWWLRKALRRF